MTDKPLLSRYAEIKAFITKDGSVIRELMHPAAQGGEKQSLAEAVVPVGAKTVLHQHHQTEEIYTIIRGEGRMRLGDRLFDIQSGDTICIVPGTPHNLENTGSEPLVLLCCCSPAYSHDDTELLE